MHGLLRFTKVWCCAATTPNLSKTLGKKWKFKFSYRNNAYLFFHHRRISKHHLAVVYTKFEVNRTNRKRCWPIQQISPHNPVFETLTTERSYLQMSSIETQTFFECGHIGGVVWVHFTKIHLDVSLDMVMLLDWYRNLNSRNERFRTSAFQNISNFWNRFRYRKVTAITKP